MAIWPLFPALLLHFVLFLENMLNNRQLLSFVCVISYSTHHLWVYENPHCKMMMRYDNFLNSLQVLLKYLTWIYLFLLFNYFMSDIQFWSNILLVWCSFDILMYSMVRPSFVHPLHQPQEHYKLPWRYVYLLIQTSYSHILMEISIRSY